MANFKWSIKLEFKLEDFWIGVFWKTERGYFVIWHTDIWVCLVPMFPIHIVIQKDRDNEPECTCYEYIGGHQMGCPMYRR